MMRYWPAAMVMVVGLLAGAVARAESPADSFGWRGNYTGLWPDANVPAEWSYRAEGVMAGLRCSSAKLPEEKVKDAPRVDDGFLRHWLVLGPFDVADSVKDLDAAQLEKEAELAPAEGDKAGDKLWRKLDVPAPERYTFGPTELQYVDLGQAFPPKLNEIAYAQTYLYAAKAGKLRVVVEHGHGLKVWCNGREVYKNAQRGEGIGNYVGISRNKLANTWPKAPSFELELRAGMNRLTVKNSSANQGGWREMRFSMWLMDEPETPYTGQNIKWRTELPERSTSTPILVKGRLYVMAEPDELLCLDAGTGQVLWTQYVNYYEALPAEAKAARAEYAEKVDPLVAQLKHSTDTWERLDLRRKIAAALETIDPANFKMKLSGHLEGHFGVVGFTTPMPCSDGRNIYVFVGTGVAACFDLDGHRKWITRLASEHLVYPAGGAVIDGKFVVFFGQMIAYDCDTGKEAWRQTEVNQTNGALLPATLAGTRVVISQKGEIVRASDGHMLWRNPDKITGDTGWNPPVVIGEAIYLPWYGACVIKILDCSKCTGEEWKPEVRSIGGITVNKEANGQWRDKWSAGSPLVWQGMAYSVDMYGTFYAVDLQAGKVAYRQDLDTRGLQNYNAIGVAASPTLLGKYIYVLDNQGTTFVIEPGREFKLAATNRIESQLERTVAIPPQEILSYAPPITDGKDIFMRGEKYLYCIGQ